MTNQTGFVTRHHTTPLAEFEKFVDVKEGAIVWEAGNKKIYVAHIPNWLAKNPENAPRVLAFQAVHGRTYVGTFTALIDAIGVLSP